jgi:hypothetical protein
VFLGSSIETHPKKYSELKGMGEEEASLLLSVSTTT